MKSVFYHRVTVMLLGLNLGLSTEIQAASINEQFLNDHRSNAIYLWMDDADAATFSRNKLRGAAANWQTFVDTGSELFLHGETIDPRAGRFSLKIDYQGPFSLQWAEVLWNNDNATIQGSGTLSWNRGWSSSSAFTQANELINPLAPAVAAVPLPGSLVMMLSALLGLGMSRFNKTPALLGS